MYVALELLYVLAPSTSWYPTRGDGLIALRRAVDEAKLKVSRSGVLGTGPTPRIQVLFVTKRPAVGRPRAPVGSWRIDVEHQAGINLSN